MPDVPERVVALAEADEVLADIGDEGVGVWHVGAAHHRRGLVGERGRDHPVADQRLPAGARAEEIRRTADADLDAPGVVRGHQVTRHRGAHATLARVRVIAAVLGERASVGPSVHVDVVDHDQPGTGGLRGGDRGRLQAGELLRPAVIQGVQRLIDDPRAARRRGRKGRIADVADHRLNALERLAQPGTVDDAHRLAAASQRLGHRQTDRTGTEHDVVNDVHHATCGRAAVTAPGSAPLPSLNSTAPAAPKTVYWLSTLTPITVDAHHPSENSTGIAGAHATASPRRPCRTSTSPCATPSTAPLTRPMIARSARPLS